MAIRTGFYVSPNFRFKIKITLNYIIGIEGSLTDEVHILEVLEMINILDFGILIFVSLP